MLSLFDNIFRFQFDLGTPTVSINVVCLPPDLHIRVLKSEILEEVAY